ncbi:MAG: LPP20 family lipoprotein [Bacteroidota bacterium]|nr:LPP20 family lipoprotein [Cytophagales bacterium]MCE2958999.1 LPP20 family lipoprotein [Flammeovirgaceae bacterium]MCZ8070164.1 LPP20 family lipoprotein [Cytophagales bacterium]
MKPTFLLCLLAAACSPAVNTSLKNDLQNTKPTWLSAKPDQSFYYIGIGHSTKTGTNNFVQEAKKSALEDLVSEIKVNVSGTSVLSQIDANKEFQEKYEQIIKTTAADEIEEFEQVDSWQDDRNYWVYYRLSKQRYKEIKDEQKRNAVSIGLDFFTKAKQAERSNDPVLALGFYYQGFRAIEKYLAEPIRLEFEGKEILLTSEVIASMQMLLDKLEIAVTPSEVTLNRRVSIDDQSFTAKAYDKASKKKIADLPLRATFEKGAGNVFPDYKTNAEGSAKILLTKISSRDLEQTVSIKVNPLSFAGGTATKIDSLVVQKLVVPRATILLNVQRPLVYVSSVERSLGNVKSTQQVTNKIKNYLANAGFEFTDQKNKAELALDVDANSEKGAVSGSIFITYVTAVIRVSSVKDNKEIYATTLDRVKGFSLDFERSSQEAYNKSLEILEKEKLPELLNSILQ